MIGLPNYIDIHSHNESSDPQVLVVQNKYADFDVLETAKWYSIGIHPWYIDEPDKQLQQLVSHINNPTVLAIGECGLDTLCKTDMVLQKRVFARQIELANQYRKPLIIHCVKAFPETLSMLKDAEVPVIFHGFNKKQSLAEEILGRGYYLSFGAPLLHTDSPAALVFASLSADRFFLETDDKTGLDIREIYNAASIIRKTGKDAIILQLQKNFQKVLHT